MKRNVLLTCLILLFSALLATFFRPFSAAEKGRPSTLKGAMFELLVLVSDLDRIKGDSPINWRSVQRKMGEMDRNVVLVRSLDTGGQYDLSLREFQQSLSAMSRLAAGEDPRTFDRLETIKQKCLQCHSAHRVERDR